MQEVEEMMGSESLSKHSNMLALMTSPEMTSRCCCNCSQYLAGNSSRYLNAGQVHALAIIYSIQQKEFNSFHLQPPGLPLSASAGRE